MAGSCDGTPKFCFMRSAVSSIAPFFLFAAASVVVPVFFLARTGHSDWSVLSHYFSFSSSLGR